MGNAYRAAGAGRPGATFVDFPADVIQGAAQETKEEEGKQSEGGTDPKGLPPLFPARPGMDPAKVELAAHVLRGAKAPLVVLGKGAAYARAEGVIRELIDKYDHVLLSVVPLKRRETRMPFGGVQPHVGREREVIFSLSFSVC
jgi:thiamine pyrophosphate-dependent acetolactate synthase large subunit-like protein